MNGNRPEPAFPSEAEWLQLPPPPISADFVARTLRAVHDHLALPPGQQALPPGQQALPPGQQAELPDTLLARYEVPPPSPDFVASTLSTVQRERTERLRSLLRRYVVPSPSPQFVATTLRALRGPQPRLLLRRLYAAAVAIAAGTLLWLSIPERTAAPRSLEQAAAVRFTDTALAFSPAPLAALSAPAPTGSAELPALDGVVWLAQGGRP